MFSAQIASNPLLPFKVEKNPIKLSDDQTQGITCSDSFLGDFWQQEHRHHHPRFLSRLPEEKGSQVLTLSDTGKHARSLIGIRRVAAFEESSLKGYVQF